MKKFFSLFALATLLCGFTACSGDDDDGGEMGSSIVGVWEYDKVGMLGGERFPYDHACSTNKDFMEFESGSSMSYTDYDSDCGAETYYATYQLEGSELKVTEDGETTTAIVDELNSNTLRFIVEEAYVYELRRR